MQCAKLYEIWQHALMFQSLLLVNFGGPRIMREIPSFLTALLTDQDVIQTRLPRWAHRFLFRRVARRRACSVCGEYRHLGGGSPIYQDTEALAAELRGRAGMAVLTFHRYLPATHSDFLKRIQEISARTDEIIVCPLFPQFSYTTTGSCARWMQSNLPAALVRKMRWVKSYSTEPCFIAVWQEAIREKLENLGWQAAETLLLFSAHGIPKSYAEKGDPYPRECEKSMRAIAQAFPEAEVKLCYQSQYGPEEWLRPYTSELVEELSARKGGRRRCLVIPHAFTSDHLETLAEIEGQYLSVLRDGGWEAERVSCLQGRRDFAEALLQIVQRPEGSTVEMLVRPS
jgi:protoporphyrin/coproporphyrin ferrochelatase